MGAWLLCAAGSAWSQGAPLATPSSTLDGPLFYQLLVGELELARGEPGTAYQVLLDAARRSGDEGVFRHVVEVAVRARAGEQALAATKAWRQSAPRSNAPAEAQAQLLMAMGRPAEMVEPLRTAIELTPAAERSGLIRTVPRLMAGSTQPQPAATAIDKALEPWRADPGTRTAATVATGRVWAAAQDMPRAVEMLRTAQRSAPNDEGMALLALELHGKDAAADEALATFLQAQPEASGIRLAYAQQLSGEAQYDRALTLVDEVTRQAQAPAGAWLMRGALLLQLERPQEAQAALERFLALRASEAPAPVESTGDGEAPPPPASDPDAQRDLAQAYLMLAQAAEQLKDYPNAERWLNQLEGVQRTPEVVVRRASLLARQGKLPQARALVQALPDATPEALHAKAVAEAQLLRDAQDWTGADGVLARALERLPDDADLLYERAMVAERLKRYDQMEALLRRVIELQPTRPHAYNALGYSFIDRNMRLDEGRALIVKALTLAPSDPFITDSLAWAEFRLGRIDEAVRLLREAYSKRPDTEIAAHLGEALWVQGRRDEAMAVWQAGRTRDRDNEVLRETLTRLKVRL